MARVEPAGERGVGAAGRVVLVVVGALVLTVLVFLVRRIAIDSSVIGSHGYIDPPDRAYAHHPWLAYLHIGPGVVYLLGAPWQLSRRFRTRHYRLHRRLGRVVLAAGLISGVFAVVFGLGFALGGVAESIAAVVFGGWFVICLSLAYRAIRRGDPATHRRWMIRAFALAVGVGLIRVWIGILFGLVGTTIEHAFAVSFWLALVMAAVGAEIWIRTARALSA